MVEGFEGCPAWNGLYRRAKALSERHGAPVYRRAQPDGTGRYNLQRFLCRHGSGCWAWVHGDEDWTPRYITTEPAPFPQRGLKWVEAGTQVMRLAGVGSSAAPQQQAPAAPAPQQQQQQVGRPRLLARMAVYDATLPARLTPQQAKRAARWGIAPQRRRLALPSPPRMASA